MHYDVIVIGGGVAGAVAALQAARAGRSVALLETSRATPRKVGETLCPDARPLLQSLGLWTEFIAAGHLPAPGIASSWGWEGLAEKDFIFHPHGHAWQLNRPAFEEMFLTAAADAGIDVRRGSAVEKFERASGNWVIRAGDAADYSSDWVIDASGRSAVLATTLKIERLLLDQLVAVHAVAIAEDDGDGDQRTFLEATADGWWYSALVPGGRRVISLQADNDWLSQQEWRDPSWFLDRLQWAPHLNGLLTRYHSRLSGAPQVASARSGRLAQFSGDGWMAVGDAAMAFDPLSGLGLFKAIESGMRAASAICSSMESARADFDAWNDQVWKEYLEQRRQFYAMETRWVGSLFWQRRR